jgi:hypothetical protein
MMHTKDERGVFWQIPETSLARAAAIAGDEMMRKAAKLMRISPRSGRMLT